MKKVNRLEKHYLWHIRRINKLLDRFPKWNLSKDIPNHELTFEKFNKIKKEVEDAGGCDAVRWLDVGDRSHRAHRGQQRLRCYADRGR